MLFVARSKDFTAPPRRKNAGILSKSFEFLQRRPAVKDSVVVENEFIEVPFSLNSYEFEDLHTNSHIDFIVIISLNFFECIRIRLNSK